VDFSYLAESLQGTSGSGFFMSQSCALTRADTNSLSAIPQSAFLLQLGLGARLQRLLDSATTPERKEDIRRAVTRLIDPLGMGTQYQVMGITTTEPGVEVYPFPTSQPQMPQSQQQKGQRDADDVA
jgi:NADH dehydrogenase [ubiquinone] 1 alpha subcomplex assembly factor 7